MNIKMKEEKTILIKLHFYAINTHLLHIHFFKNFIIDTTKKNSTVLSSLMLCRERKKERKTETKRK